MFQKCPNCKDVWEERGLFLSDGNLRIEGYYPNFEMWQLGSIDFKHCCGADIKIPAETFMDMYSKPAFQEHPKDCEKNCLFHRQEKNCPRLCECGYIRDIYELIDNWPKAVEK